MKPRLIGTALVACLVCLAAPARAQSLAATAVDSTSSAAPVAAGADSSAIPAAGASASVAPVGAHYAVQPRTANATAAAKAQLGLGQSRALMIVGAAGILVGAIVGGQAGTVFMVGGAVVGLIGLYEYIQ